MDPAKPLIAAKGIGKSYSLKKDTVEVLSDISFTVCKGEYISIMGQSGSGKSTLLNIIGCLDKPTCGEFHLNGQAVHGIAETRLAEIRNRDIGFIFQSFTLLPRLTVEANVDLPLVYRNLPARVRRELVREVLERYGLWERRKHFPSEISGGQRQRVAIARALVKKPSIILADEPTGNLDSRNAGEVLEAFQELHDEGQTLLVITHDKTVASQAGRVLTIADGRIR